MLGAPSEGVPAPNAERLNSLTSCIIKSAIEIHRAFGPGLLESAYVACLKRDLMDAQIPVKAQQAIPLVYRNLRISCAYRADLVVDGCVLVEVKAIEVCLPIHSQQLYTYLRLGNYPVGLLLNFGAGTMKAGIRRMVNHFPDK